MLAAGAAWAATALVTTDLNVRAGPGTNYQVIGLLPSGSIVDVAGCLRGYAWCRINWRGYDAWASSRYLAVQEGRYRGRDYTVYGPAVGVPVIGGVIISRSFGDAPRYRPRPDYRYRPDRDYRDYRPDRYRPRPDDNRGDYRPRRDDNRGDYRPRRDDNRGDYRPRPDDNRGDYRPRPRPEPDRSDNRPRPPRPEAPRPRPEPSRPDVKPSGPVIIQGNRCPSGRVPIHGRCD